jgi:hypothetical protein
LLPRILFRPRLATPPAGFGDSDGLALFRHVPTIHSVKYIVNKKVKTGGAYTQGVFPMEFIGPVFAFGVILVRLGMQTA